MAAPTSKTELTGRIESLYNNRAANKNMANRVWNSGATAAVRRTVDAGRMNGTAAGIRAGIDKLGVPIARTVVNSAAKRIPIPMVPEIISMISGDLESWVRSWSHDRNFGKAVGDEDKLKFKIKEMDFSSLDSHRQKLDVAVRDLNKKIDKFRRDDITKKRECSCSMCDEYTEIFDAMFQLKRRLEKLLNLAMEMQTLSSAVVARVAGINMVFQNSKLEDAIIDDLYASISKEHTHAQCSNCLRDVNAPAHLNANRRAAKVISGNKIFSVFIGHAVDQVLEMGQSQLASLAKDGKFSGIGGG